ncbi:TraR/DksA family transcriptional regulator [Nocardioides marmoribigeumensis]|jgi:RNA polymerase-binding transcription factor DksA|uniref:RNA polymerase-binding transcription factor DksA n=1 Tax=Nocardioides marmoribigeumensis TaxID=433649 RepID=A0ABU2BV71_9ACTN|nr:TraR/DksA C4-type zinc finger protein [Nocardioides marmoribigeumensis]MDR7362529.1 RNA polymerase-binding transcription factor DksA [Nocardioides marmoribigeumensis]
MTSLISPSTSAAPPRPGPGADLVELPEPTGLDLTSPTEVDDHLAAVERARQRQLDAMRPTRSDPVAEVCRANLERILADVRAARARVASGRYGTCTRCGLAIAPDRLALRPWAAACTRCTDAQR